MRAPRILFVLGKGGVGRSTVSAALGLAAARRGERVLVFGWTVADPIAPWFGKPPAGTTPVEIAANLSVSTYSLDEALRAYFVDHLHLPRFHRRVVRSAGVRALVDAVPGIVVRSAGARWAARPRSRPRSHRRRTRRSGSFGRSFASGMLERVAAARRHIERDARLLLVTTIRDDAAATAAAIATALRSIGLAPTAMLVNRSLPAAVVGELAGVDAGSLPEADRSLVRYARAYAATQASVVDAVRDLSPARIMVPLVAHGEAGLVEIAAALRSD